MACQATTPSRPPVTTGGDDSSVPVGTATKKPVQATPTPVASATPTAGPLTADVSSPWSLSSSATASTTVGSAGGATAGGSAGAQLPRKVARHGLSYSDGVLLVAGGLLEPPSPGVGGAIISDFATASVTASGSLSTIGAWATSSLPIRICDQGLTVDHKKRFVLIGGVTQSDAGQNSAVKSVYVGTMAAGSKVLNWVK
ncbi:MAG: hypothetical protein FJZ00_12325, partial [Candidatus Sericytochromatia bacterium]|nr:hypothetical protein [Candidatus Tanganyikabacteria bacterium]